MHHRSTALVGALALGASALFASAPAASAAVPCVITSYSPRTVVIGLSPVAVNFGVSTTGCSRTGWSVDVTGTGGSGWPMWLFAYDGSPTEVLQPSLDVENADAGYRYDAVVEAYNSDWDTSTAVFADSFVVKRRTYFSAFNATPEPVYKGKPITVAATLRMADWNNNRYVAVQYGTVNVQFERAGSSTWTTIKTVRASSTGYVRTTATAGYDGSWRLQYGGSSWRGGSTSSSDYVDVR